jgi:hypothetical protein
MEFLEKIPGFLDYASKATPIVLTVAGLLSYYYREKIKSVLAKALAVDVESLRHQFAKELADLTAAHQRDLESYKVSLIAETERARALQDVRKAVALRAAERRFGAVAAVLDAHLGLDTSISSLVQMPQSTEPNAIKDFLQRRQQLIDRLSKYNVAYSAAQLFLPVGLRLKILDVTRASHDVLALRKEAGSPAVASDHEQVRTLLRTSLDLEDDLRQLIQEFEKA